jgi:uncharacterized protein (TIGR02996 family)
MTRKAKPPAKRATKARKPVDAWERFDPTLEAQIAASPDDDALRRVYADWLLEAGNPRGELAALQLAGKEDAAKAFLDAHTEQLLGERLDGYADWIAWCGGFWQAFEVDEPFDEIRSHPSARLLRTLHLKLMGPFEWVVEWLAAGRWPALRSLILGGVHVEGQDVGEMADWTCSNFELLVPAMPRLEQLTVMCGDFRLGDFPALRAFTCDGYGLRIESLRSLFAVKLPSLTKLDLNLDFLVGDVEYTIPEAADFAPLFSGDLFPALREVVLRAGRDKALIAAAKAAPLARRAKIEVAG